MDIFPSLIFVFLVIGSVIYQTVCLPRPSQARTARPNWQSSYLTFNLKKKKSNNIPQMILRLPLCVSACFMTVSPAASGVTYARHTAGAAHSRLHFYYQ